MRSGNPVCPAEVWVTGIKSKPGFLPLLPGTEKTVVSVATESPWAASQEKGWISGPFLCVSCSLTSCWSLYLCASVSGPLSEDLLFPDSVSLL